MTRVSPPELERALPGPHASISSTFAPRLRRCSAVHPPNAPAPMTTTRGADFVKNGSRAAKGTAATAPRNARREMDKELERHSRADTDRARLIRQIADPCTRAAFLI